MSIIEKPLEISSKEETNRSEKRQELTTGPSEKRSIFFFHVCLSIGQQDFNYAFDICRKRTLIVHIFIYPIFDIFLKVYDSFFYCLT